MSTPRLFAYNTGSTLPDTAKYGNLAVFTGTTVPSGVQWWGGPDEDLGYVIAEQNTTGNQPNPLNIPAYVQFYRTDSFTDSQFLSLTNYVTGQNLSTANAAKDYLFANGYWTSYTGSPVTYSPQVNAGGFSSFYINNEGVAYGWGDNGVGQLGDNSVLPRSTPVAICGGLIFSQISAGNSHLLGITTTGIAYGWGESNIDPIFVVDSNAIGTNTTQAPYYSTPVAVCGGLTFSQVSAGFNFSLGITTSGIGYGWGQNFNDDSGVGGQLGINSQSNKITPVAICGGLTFSQISAGVSYSLGITTTGIAYAWGAATDGRLGDNQILTNRSTPVAVCGGLTFSQVSAGGSHSLGITTTGIAYAWGRNNFGQLGDNSTVDKSTPVAVCTTLTFTQVSAAENFSLGITANGDVYAWGDNTYGQLGDDSTVDKSTPVAVCGGLTFSQIDTGNYHSVGITTTGVVYAWGYNNIGQLGDNSTVDKSTPVAVCGL